MDIPHSHHCGFRLLLLLSILCIVLIPSKGDSDPLVSSLEKSLLKGKSTQYGESSVNTRNEEDMSINTGQYKGFNRTPKWSELHNDVLSELLIEQFLCGNITNNILKKEARGDVVDALNLRLGTSYTKSVKCSYPNIIGCHTCSKDNMMGSFFNSHGHLPEPNFSKILDKEIRSGDSCEEMLVNADIFGLSSVLRELMGEGSHRQLVTTMVLCNHPKFTQFVNEHFCEAVIIEYLPTGVFSDPFELQHLVNRGVFLNTSVSGDTNLELPSTLSNISVVEIHINVKIDAQEIVVQLPLHSRYPPLNSSGYINITIGKPHLFIRCRPKISQSEACLWTLIDLDVSSGNTMTWRIPCGNVVHTRAVTIITFLSAIFCSFLIVLSTLYHSKKDKIKME